MMVNWGKALANGGVAFFTTLAGLLGAGAVIGESLPPIGLIVGALIVGGIQAGLSIFLTLKEETENTTGNPIKKGISYITLF